ncbi:hypothetical protein JKP88DRAFT_220683 [Tribonema minus]|uniref:Uncharacterized protein n=1 Tax=Tribonema minus TaxID=303371 RepID=A0A835YXJ1_9STRA|nr:hypothetical protein JKP88DRAFT_220683 [Tribonema minus]
MYCSLCSAVQGNFAVIPALLLMLSCHCALLAQHSALATTSSLQMLSKFPVAAMPCPESLASLLLLCLHSSTALLITRNFLFAGVLLETILVLLYTLEV